MPTFKGRGICFPIFFRQPFPTYGGSLVGWECSAEKRVENTHAVIAELPVWIGGTEARWRP
jgi:hypothetical protein